MALPQGYISWRISINYVLNEIVAHNLWQIIHNIAIKNRWSKKRYGCIMHKYATSIKIPNDFFIHNTKYFDINDLRYELQWVKNMTNHNNFNINI